MNDIEQGFFIEDLLHSGPMIVGLYATILLTFLFFIMCRSRSFSANIRLLWLLAPCLLGAVTMCIKLCVVTEAVAGSCGGLNQMDVVRALTAVYYPFIFGCFLSLCAVIVNCLPRVSRSAQPQ